MIYDEITMLCGQLNYRDKLRLAQLLIQTARKEEENLNPEKRIEPKTNISETKNKTPNDIGSIESIANKILKLKPGNRKTLTNSVRSMFQFQGGISESDEKKIITKLQKLKHIKIDSNDKVSYP